MVKNPKEYYREYYLKNRDRLNAKRHAKYHDDPEFKAKVLGYCAKYHSKKARKNKRVKIRIIKDEAPKSISETSEECSGDPISNS